MDISIHNVVAISELNKHFVDKQNAEGDFWIKIVSIKDKFGNIHDVHLFSKTKVKVEYQEDLIING